MITNELIGFPLLIYSNAKDSGLFTKGLIELKDLVKDIVVIALNLTRLSNIKWLFAGISRLILLRGWEKLLLIVSCEYYNSLS